MSRQNLLLHFAAGRERHIIPGLQASGCYTLEWIAAAKRALAFLDPGAFELSRCRGGHGCIDGPPAFLSRVVRGCAKAITHIQLICRFKYD